MAVSSVEKVGTDLSASEAELLRELGRTLRTVRCGSVDLTVTPAARRRFARLRGLG